MPGGLIAALHAVGLGVDDIPLVQCDVRQSERIPISGEAPGGKGELAAGDHGDIPMSFVDQVPNRDGGGFLLADVNRRGVPGRRPEGRKNRRDVLDSEVFIESGPGKLVKNDDSIKAIRLDPIQALQLVFRFG